MFILQYKLLWDWQLGANVKDELVFDIFLIKYVRFNQLQKNDDEVH